MSKVSICVPTYEYNGKGVMLLQNLLDSLSIVNNKNFELVISDQSTDNQICNLISWNQYEYDIKYCRCDKLPSGNMSYNTNNSIKQATGDIIKPLFQDDVINSPSIIDVLYDVFENKSVGWVGMKYIHVFEEGVEPRWRHCHDPFYHKDTFFGHNKVSSPSAVAFRKDDSNFFDTNVTMMMDCEFYHRMQQKYGVPLFLLNEPFVAIGQHPEQYQNNADLKSKMTEEFLYMFKKHGIVNLLMDEIESPWKPEMQEALQIINSEQKEASVWEKREEERLKNLLEENL